MTLTGEDHAWDLLERLKPVDMPGGGDVRYDSASRSYTLSCFGCDITVSIQNRTMNSEAVAGSFLLSRLKFFSELAILRYLLHGRTGCESGRLIKPSDLPGGDFFLSGTHVLPLDRLAELFGRDTHGFIQKAENLGGVIQSFGDVSVKLYPFAAFPVILILWAGDEEFPAAASLLVDAACCTQLPVDVIWSTAMMTLEMIIAPDFT